MSSHKRLTPQFSYRSLALLLLAALCAASVFTPGQARPAEITFTVNTIVDAHDSVPGDHICYDGVDGCSLRAAIEEAFYNSPDNTTINFWSSLAGSALVLDGSLGTILWAASSTTLDGGTNNISLNGTNLAAGASVLRISSSSNTVKNLAIHHAPQDAVQVGDFSGVGAGSYNTLDNLVLYANGYAGVFFTSGSGGGGQHNTLTNSLVGASSREATACVPGEGNGADGVHIDPGANDTTVTGSRIVCSAGNGVYISGTGGSPGHVAILYSDIGTDGTHDLGNLQAGVLVEQASETNILNNVISGNDQHGVRLQGSTSAWVRSNQIGLNRAGDTALGNSGCGVAVTDSANNNQIGGSDPAASRNVISGNSGNGVCLTSGSYSNLIDSNLIGLNQAGSAAIPNGLAGVAVVDSSANNIGSLESSARQFISGNGTQGVYVSNSVGIYISPSTWIGLGSDEASAIGNGSSGVLLLNNSANNYIFPSVVAYNNGPGFVVSGNTSVNNHIEPYISVFGNAGIPIDLGDDGPTDNGAHPPAEPGPNNWLQYPVITGGTSSHLEGITCANCRVFIYLASGDPRAPGGGGSYLRNVTADASGNWSVDLPPGAYRSGVTTFACQSPCGAGADTSEMSPRLKAKVFAPAVWFRPH